MKRILLVCIVLIYVFCLYGCNIATTSSDPVLSSTTSTSPKSSSATSQSEKASRVTDPLANEPGTLPIAKEKIKLSIAGILNSNVVSYDDNYLTQYLEEKTGIEIQFDTYTGADAGQKLDLQVNSGSKLSDIIAGIGVNNDTIRYKYGQAGAIISLNEYYLEIADWFDVKCQELGYSPEKILNEIRSEDGQIYAAPARSNSPGGIYALHAFINHDWLQKLNLQLPMTSDEFITVLRAFRDNDPNENGKKDEIPMIGSTSGWNEQPLKYLMNMFIYSDRTTQNYFLPLSQTNGKIDVAYDKEEYRDFLRYANLLVGENLLSSLSFTQDSTQCNALKQSEPNIAGVVLGTTNTCGNNRPAYQPLEAMEGPDGVQLISVAAPAATGAMAITRDCQHPEIAFMWMHYFMADDEALRSTRYGELGVDWRYATTDEKGNYEHAVSTLANYDGLVYKGPVFIMNNTWGVPNQKHWHETFMLPFIGFPEQKSTVFDGDETKAVYTQALALVMNLKYAPALDDLVNKINYSQEESDKWADIRPGLLKYVNESMERFAMGDIDPNSDSDWNNYLKELNSLKYKELIAVDQIAYDRTIGK